MLESCLDAHRHRHCEQQPDDAEQYRAADKRHDYDDRMNSGSLPEHQRADHVVDR